MVKVGTSCDEVLKVHGVISLDDLPVTKEIVIQTVGYGQCDTCSKLKQLLSLFSSKQAVDNHCHNYC